MRIPRPLTRAIATLSTALIVLLTSATAFAQVKKAGFDSEHGGGKGEEFNADELARIEKVLEIIKGLGTITLNGKADATQNPVAPATVFKGADIEKDLRKMLTEKRIGKGVGADKTTAAEADVVDGEGPTDGDRINIADHHLKDADNKTLAGTLAHEWVHAQEKGQTGAYWEDRGYQTGMKIYLQKGGKDTDHPYLNDADWSAYFKAIRAGQLQDNSKAPKDGVRKRHSGCGHDYFMIRRPGKLYFWKNGASVDSVAAFPNHSFYEMVGYPLAGGCERLLLFGANLSNPANPIGTLTVVDAGQSGFTFRRDSTLTTLKYPFSASIDSSTGRIYLFDANFSGPGVVVLRDLNGDRVPDLQSTFAPRGFAGVDSALGLQWAIHEQYGAGVALWNSDVHGLNGFGARDSLTLITDTNADGVADTWHRIPGAELAAIPPTISRAPIWGHTTLQLVGMRGHSVQVRVTDANGNANFGTLGSAVFTASGVPQLVTLARALYPDEYLIAVDLTANTQSATPTQVSNDGVNVILSGAQQIPGNSSTAIGFATIKVDPVTNTLQYFIVHNVSGATSAHIHGSAGRDKSAGVLIGLPSPASPMSGAVAYSQAIETTLLQGRAYLDIHSTTFPGGEIRGQLPAAPLQVPALGAGGMIALAMLLTGVGSSLLLRRGRWEG